MSKVGKWEVRKRRWRKRLKCDCGNRAELRAREGVAEQEREH